MLPGCPALAGDVGPLVLARLAGRLLQVEAAGGEVVQPLSLRVKHNLHLLLSIQPSLGLYRAVLSNNESNVDIMTLMSVTLQENKTNLEYTLDRPGPASGQTN